MFAAATDAHSMSRTQRVETDVDPDCIARPATATEVKIHRQVLALWPPPFGGFDEIHGWQFRPDHSYPVAYLNRTLTAPVKLTDFGSSWKREIRARGMIQGNSIVCAVANSPEHLNNAVCSVAFRALNKVIQRFTRLDPLVALKQGIAFIDSQTHVMNGQSN